MLLRQSLMFGRVVWGQRLGGDQWECRFSRLVPLAHHLTSMRFFDESSYMTWASSL
jgi:hypothetical protein